MRNTVLKQQKKIKNLQDSKRRLKARISSFNSLLKFLMQRRYITETAASTIQVSHKHLYF